MSSSSSSSSPSPSPSSSSTSSSSTRSINSLFQVLPHDVLELIASNMQAPDICSLVSTCRYLKTTLGDKASFWKNLLLQREGGEEGGSPFSLLQTENNNDNDDDDDDDDYLSARLYKEHFLRAEYCRNLSSVKWHAVNGSRDDDSPPGAREGHNCCLLGEDHNLLVVTGGFTDDTSVYIKNLRTGGSSSANNNNWQRIRARIPNANFFAYGSSLTRLNATTAVRFGGFQAGGYSHETSVVATLTITENANIGYNSSPSFIAQWRFIPTRFADDDDTDDDTGTHNNNNLDHRGGRNHQNNEEETTRHRHHHHQGQGGFSLPRAYHTATLLHNRYLYIVGGMQSRRGCSVLDPICLDCETWTWILCRSNNDIDTAAAAAAAATRGASSSSSPSSFSLAAVIPSGRHGHSVVWDKFRNRLVLFGGGSGTDLLRSGRDNSEVWEFKAAAAPTSSNPTSSAVAAAVASTASSPPTPQEFLSKISSSQWRLIHQDQNDYYDHSDDDDDDDDDNSNGAPGEPMDHEAENGTSTAAAAVSTSSTMLAVNRLRPAETLNLGRCHNAHHVARDTVILIMGSGKPSTNSILAYNLKTDSFVRPNLNPSFLPTPRFTFASAFIPHLSCIFVHGGYSTQSSQAIAGMALLDLTPALNKQAATASPPPTLNGNRSIRHNGTTTTTASISPLCLFRTMGLFYAPSSQVVTDQHVLDWHRVMRETHRHRQPRLFHFLAAMGQRMLVYDLDDDGDGDNDNEP